MPPTVNLQHDQIKHDKTGDLDTRYEEMDVMLLWFTPPAPSVMWPVLYDLSCLTTCDYLCFYTAVRVRSATVILFF